MEGQAGREPFGHSQRFRSKSGSRVRTNARAQSSIAGRGVKREALDDQKAGLNSPKSGSPLFSCNDTTAMLSTFQGPNSKLKLSHSRAAHEADAWLRDEPVAAVGRNCNGPGGNDGNAEIGGSHGLTDGAISRGCSSERGDAAYLFTLLRSTTIKESVIREGIERLGGGQVGLNGIIRAILFWLDAKERHNKTKSSESGLVHSENSFREDFCEELDKIVDAADGHDGNAINLNNSSPIDPATCSVKTPSSCGDGDSSLCDSTTGDSGSGEYDWLPAYEGQPHAFMGGPEATGGLSGRLRSQGSAQSKEYWDPGVPSVRELLRQDKLQLPMLLRKLSPSSDCSGGLRSRDIYSFDDTFAQQFLLGRQSSIAPAYISPSNEFQAFLSTATPETLGAQGLYSGANPFGPFNLSPISPLPPEPHSMDFNAFDAQGHVLSDENLGLGGSIHGCGQLDRLGSLGHLSAETTSIDRKQSGPRLGLVSKSKASPAACTRLARKQRMDRNRKAALYQVNRGAFDSSAVLAGKSGGICCSSRNTFGSQGNPSSDGPSNRPVDRRQHENLQFLLMKVLRPSDVGNLGRIVLPKKDAESHLPWLGAREGIQLPCEDYDTGEMMKLRYRFWPNNKSRMYLLENTGDFVKRHLLQESDRMFIYRNQSLGTYIIRARKAQDCVGGKAEDVVEEKPDQGQLMDTEGDGVEITEQDSPGGSCSSGTSSLSGTETRLDSPPEVSETCDPASLVIISQDDLLNFADLPDAPMGEGTEHLVRFPSLESFDVELLDLAPVSEEDVTSCRLKATE